MRRARSRPNSARPDKRLQPPDEARSVLRAQLGDREALEAVLRSVQAPLRRFISHIVGVAEADDVLQNALILIARKLNWLEEPRLFRAWAFRITSRVASTC